MILGIQKEQGKTDYHKPILPSLLKKLVWSLSSAVSSNFTRHLLTATFVLAFYALFRIGKVTMSVSGHDNVLSISDSKLIELQFRNF